jgi:hypothetical protein
LGIDFLNVVDCVLAGNMLFVTSNKVIAEKHTGVGDVGKVA